MAGCILIVDDSPTLLERVRSHLEADRYEVHTAVTYPEARPHLGHADLVLVDFHMPGQDGSSMLISLRAASRGSSTPPLLYLHTTDSEKAASYKQLGFDGVIGMKGNFDLLSKQVSAAMRLRRLSQRLKIG